VEHDSDESASDSDENQEVSTSYKANKENLRLETNQNMDGRRSNAQKQAQEKQKQAQEKQAEEAAAKDKKIAELQEKLTLVRAHARKLKEPKSNKKVKISEEERAWRNRIMKNVKIFIWTVCIFIHTDGKLCKATKVLMREMCLKEFDEIENNKERKRAEADWIAENQDLVRRKLNEERNYAQSQLRQEIVKCMMAGKWVPTVEEIEKVVIRDDKFLKTEKGKKVFQYYVDVLLMKVAGKEHWDKDIRYHATISNATHPRTPLGREMSCITPEIEAFLYMVFLNCYKKWTYLADKKNEANHNGEKFVYDAKDPNYVCEYTRSDAGQQEWGGWTPEAREKFREYRGKNAEGRQKETTAAHEQAVLTQLRIDNKLEGPNAVKKTKKRKRAQLEEVDSDDEDPFKDVDN
jgi:chemotaxis protein histidine kinase CheA